MQLLLFILLGCNVPTLLEGRIKKAVDYANAANATQIDWFLSGGIKNPAEETVTEAEKMMRTISTKPNATAWNFIRDDVATNTAENFIMAEKAVDIGDYNGVYVITSDFHYERAKKIADKVIVGNNFMWVLAPEELVDSRQWERVHIRNVDADVSKARQKYQL
jgi:vancomycin permeability regulator SanA